MKSCFKLHEIVMQLKQVCWNRKTSYIAFSTFLSRSRLIALISIGKRTHPLVVLRQQWAALGMFVRRSICGRCCRPARTRRSTPRWFRSRLDLHCPLLLLTGRADASLLLLLPCTVESERDNEEEKKQCQMSDE